MEKPEEFALSDQQQQKSSEESPIYRQLVNVQPLVKEIRDLGIMANKILTQLSEVKIAQEVSSKPQSTVQKRERIQ